MPAIWLPGAEQRPTNNGGTMDGVGGARATHHITWDKNGTAAAPLDLIPFDSLAGYFSGAGKGSAPHLLADPFTGRVAQFIPADQSARALINAPGGVETNRHGTVNLQIEWLFFPYCRIGGKVYPTLKDTPAAGLDRIMSWLRSWGVPDVWPMGQPTWNGNRNSGTWQSVPGHYGHSQIPENDHTDPGPIFELFAADAPKGLIMDEEVRAWFGQLNAMLWGNKNDLAALLAAISALSGLVAAQHGLSADEVAAKVKAAVTEALATNAVSVDVNVHGNAS